MDQAHCYSKSNSSEVKKICQYKPSKDVIPDPSSFEICKSMTSVSAFIDTASNIQHQRSG